MRMSFAQAALSSPTTKKQRSHWHRGKTVLAESTSVTGNFEVIALQLLNKLAEQPVVLTGGDAAGTTETTPLRGPSSSSSSSSAANGSTRVQLLKFENGSEYTFFVSRAPATPIGFEGESIMLDALVMLCLCEAAAPARVAFAFLAEVRDKFTRGYKPVEYERAIAYSFNAEFSGVLSSQMQRFNGDGAHDERVRRVREQLDDLKDVMVRNIDSLLNRGEALDILVEKTDRMQQAAFKFEKASERTAQLLWWKKVRCMAGGVLFAVLFLFLMIVVGCGGFDFSNCS